MCVPLKKEDGCLHYGHNLKNGSKLDTEGDLEIIFLQIQDVNMGHLPNFASNIKPI